MRDLDFEYIRNQVALTRYGISPKQLHSTIQNVYNVLDSIDEKLIESNTARFAELVELANLSAMIGNLFRSGLIKITNGLFTENLRWSQKTGQ